MDTLLVNLVRIGLGILIGLPVLLYLFQEKLLFHPQRLGERELDAVRRGAPNAEEVKIRTDDGVTLHGWLIKPSGRAAAPLLIYFGGNAEEISRLIGQQPRLRGWALLLMSYRGYGGSGGAPSEEALFADALRIHDEMQRRGDIDGQCIAAMGRSLGCGVAVYLASKRRLRATVLVTPYDSIIRVAQRRYPTVPVKWLLRHPFDSLRRATQLHTPMLALVAENDEVIPPRHARTLFDAWAGPKHWLLLPGTDHNDISDHRRYWPAIAAFLSPLHPYRDGHP